MNIIDICHSIWDAVECGNAFEPIKTINQNLENGNWMQFENLEDGYDGLFPRISDWNRLINAIDNEGICAFLRWTGRSKMKFNNGYCTVERTGKYDDTAVLKFKEPIHVVIGYLNEEPITKEVNEIHGRFSYEWYWLTNGRQKDKANGLEVWFDCQQYFNR